MDNLGGLDFIPVGANKGKKEFSGRNWPGRE
jgi:hypothetical protein